MRGALFVALALALLTSAGKASHAAPLRIAYSSISGAMLPLWVAKDKKLFDKHGVDVEVMYIRGVAIEALLAGLLAELNERRISPHAAARRLLEHLREEDHR